MGFVLEPEEAQRLIEKDPRNRDVLFPYLNGEDLNSRPDQSPSRWVINFFDWPIEKAMQIPRLPPHRRGEGEAGRRKKTSGDFALRNHCRRSGGIMPRSVPNSTNHRQDGAGVSAGQNQQHPPWSVPLVAQVYNEQTVVFVDCPLSVMQSNVHEDWARNYSSTLRTDLQYTPSDCFETFPFPHLDDRLDSIEQTYHDHRRQIMLPAKRA